MICLYLPLYSVYEYCTCAFRRLPSSTTTDLYSLHFSFQQSTVCRLAHLQPNHDPVHHHPVFRSCSICPPSAAVIATDQAEVQSTLVRSRRVHGGTLRLFVNDGQSWGQPTYSRNISKDRTASESAISFMQTKISKSLVSTYASSCASTNPSAVMMMYKLYVFLSSKVNEFRCIFLKGSSEVDDAFTIVFFECRSFECGKTSNDEYPFCLEDLFVQIYKLLRAFKSRSVSNLVFRRTSECVGVSPFSSFVSSLLSRPLLEKMQSEDWHVWPSSHFLVLNSKQVACGFRMDSLLSLYHLMSFQLFHFFVCYCCF